MAVGCQPLPRITSRTQMNSELFRSPQPRKNFGRCMHKQTASPPPREAPEMKIGSSPVTSCVWMVLWSALVSISGTTAEKHTGTKVAYNKFANPWPMQNVQGNPRTALQLRFLKLTPCPASLIIKSMLSQMVSTQACASRAAKALSNLTKS